MRYGAEINNKKLSKDLKYFLSGSLSLGLSSLFSLITPILAVPFLIKTVGLSNYGMSIIFFSMAMILSLIIEFGFNISGVNRLSKANSKSKISEIIIPIVLTKGVIFLLLTFVLILGFLFVPYLRLHSELLLYSLLIPLSAVLNLNWALQGAQKIKVLSMVVILGKVIYLLGIFLTINQPENFIYINAWFGIGLMVSGVVSLVVLFKYYPPTKIAFDRSIFIYEIKSSYHYFVSNISIYLSSYLFPSIIGVFTSTEMVGVYSVVEKIYNLLRGIFPIYQTLMLPRLSSAVEVSLKNAENILKQTYGFILLFIIAEILGVYLFIDYIVLYFTADYIELTKQLVLLSFIGLLAVTVNCPLYLLILALDMKKIIMKIFLIGPMLSITICLVLVSFTGLIGAVITLVTIELFYALMLFVVYKRLIC